MASLSPEFFEQLKRHEGVRLEAYHCTAGKKTIGIGHNIDANPCFADGSPIPDVITQEQCDDLFMTDVANVIRELHEAWPNVQHIQAQARREAFYNMAFQLGVEGLMKFRRTLRAAETAQWRACSMFMRESLWYRQTPKRAKELATQILKGEYA